MMVDIVSFPINRAKVAVSVTSYQQADNQRLETNRAIHQAGQASGGIDSAQTADPGKEHQALRQAARVQRVEQAARQDRPNKQNNSDSGEFSARRGETLDIKA